MWIVGVLFRKCWEWTSMSPNRVHQWQHHWLLGRQSPNMCYFSRSRLIGALYCFSMFLSPHFVGVCLFAEKQNSGCVFNNNAHKFSICLAVRWFWAPTRPAWCFDLWKTFIAGEPVPTNKDSTRVSEAFWVHGCKCMWPITANFVVCSKLCFKTWTMRRLLVMDLFMLAPVSFVSRNVPSWQMLQHCSCLYLGQF